MPAAQVIPQTYRRPYREPIRTTILSRVANNEKTAFAECVDTYGGMVWALAKKFTASTIEAEKAASDIFIDIWGYATNDGTAAIDERALIQVIAMKRLFRLKT